MIRVVAGFTVSSIVALLCCLVPAVAVGAEGEACREECNAIAERFFAACREEGGEACERRAAERRAACIAERCEQEPPPEPGCEDRCELKAGEVFRACIADGGGEDRCHQRSRETFRECVAAECEEPPPPPEPGCEDRCEMKAGEVFRACIADGVGEDRCHQRSRETFRECVAAECEEPPPPPEPSCEDACREHAERVARNCLEDGGGELDCLARRDEAFMTCVARECEEPPPPEPGCEDRCEMHARGVFAECIEAGMGEEACRARREEAFAVCVERECDRPPPPEPTCKDRCEEASSRVFRECRENGGNEEECHARREEAFHSCVERECEEPPPPRDCEAACENHAKRVFNNCLEDGGGEEACAERRAAAFESCVARECREGEPPPEPSCEDLCEERAAAVFRECREENPEGGECEQRSRAVLRECVAQCEDGEPPPPTGCEAGCRGRGEAVFVACREAGGSRSLCNRQASTIVGLCLERCGEGNPCENRCALAAQIVLTGCTFADLPPAECARLANLVLEGCVSECGPEPPSCAERCDAIESEAIRECIERGGGEDECVALGEEVAAKCRARCEGGGEMPGCDAECREKAADMEEACRADGGSEEHCGEVRRAFLEKCLEAHGDECERAAQLEQAAFQPFVRGDVDRDGGINVTDPVIILNELFLGRAPGACEDARDANDDGEIDVSDPLTLLDFLFLGGATPRRPFPSRGQDPTFDLLLCQP